MHPVVYYILFFLGLGAVGMACTSRNTSAEIKKQHWLKYFTYILFTGVVVLSFFYHFFFYVACFIILAAAAEIIKVSFGGKQIKQSILFAAFSVFLLTAVAFLLFASSFTVSFYIFIYMQVMVFDGFSQITGQIFGKRKLCPSISPAKTWEGFLGGWFCCCAVAVMAASWVSFSAATGFLFGVITGISALCGDILASWYKRITKVKDYSNWLPGQGGFLDRFDSFLTTGAVYYLLTEFIFRNYFATVFNLIRK
jgi:phosphatidate cytidylyltransferase